MLGLGGLELLIIFVVLFIIVAGVSFFFRAILKLQKPNFLNTQSERLKELQKMKDNGLVTEDEFNKKRNEILSNL